MSSRSLEPLRNCLISEGISPRYAGKLIAELHDHLRDAEDECLERGMSADDARAFARERIGADETIVQCVLATNRRRSFGRRWPLTVFLVLPLLAFPALVILFTMVLGLLHGIAMMLDVIPRDEWIHSFVYAIAATIPLSLLIIAALLTHYAHSRRCSILLPLSGLVLLALLSSFLDLQLGPAGDGAAGSTLEVLVSRPALPLYPFAMFALVWILGRRAKCNAPLPHKE